MRAAEDARLRDNSPRLAHLRNLFEGRRLTPVQRRIAQILVSHPEEVDYLSSAQVADLAGVSQPSVVRFAIALGYAGYAELRGAIRSLSRDIEDPASEARNTFQAAVAGERSNLCRLEASLAQPQEVLAAGTALARSQPLTVLGLRASIPLARYFAYFAAKVVPDVRVIDEGGSRLYDRLDQARRAGEQRCSPSTCLDGRVKPRRRSPPPRRSASK